MAFIILLIKTFKLVFLKVTFDLYASIFLSVLICCLIQLTVDDWDEHPNSFELYTCDSHDVTRMTNLRAIFLQNYWKYFSKFFFDRFH